MDAVEVADFWFALVEPAAREAELPEREAEP
jgi:hypothetical protein